MQQVKKFWARYLVSHQQATLLQVVSSDLVTFLFYRMYVITSHALTQNHCDTNRKPDTRLAYEHAHVYVYDTMSRSHLYASTSKVISSRTRVYVHVLLCVWISCTRKGNHHCRFTSCLECGGERTWCCFISSNLFYRYFLSVSSVVRDTRDVYQCSHTSYVLHDILHYSGFEYVVFNRFISQECD